MRIKLDCAADVANEKEWIEERAGALEFMARMTREQAERQARIEVDGWKKSHQTEPVQP